MLGSPDEAWVLAARPVLRSNKAAVKIPRGRAISRKGSNAERKGYSTGNRLLLGWLHGWGGKLQRELPAPAGLPSAMEGVALLQHLAARSRHSVAVQAASGMRDDAPAPRRR